MLIRNLWVLFIMFFVGGSMLSAQDIDYIGAAKCKVCHNKTAKGAQYKQWLGTRHAKAMESLSPEEAQDPNCIKCHATAATVDEDLIVGLKMSEGVSCESCHGPGGKYKSNTIMKSREESIANGLILPTEEVCRKCHNSESPTFKGFDFEESFKKITHPMPVQE